MNRNWNALRFGRWRKTMLVLYFNLLKSARDVFIVTLQPPLQKTQLLFKRQQEIKNKNKSGLYIIISIFFLGFNPAQDKQMMIVQHELQSKSVSLQNGHSQVKIYCFVCVWQRHEFNNCYLHSCPQALLMSAALSHSHIPALLTQPPQ